MAQFLNACSRNVLLTNDITCDFFIASSLLWGERVVRQEKKQAGKKLEEARRRTGELE